MTRHVFPRAVLTLACLLAALGGVRAQDGDGPQPAPPKPTPPAESDDPDEPAESGEAEKPETDGDIEAAAGAETPPAPPKPPAVGEAFPERLAAQPLTKPGAEPESEEGVTLASLVGTEPRPVVLVFWSSRCTVCRRYGEVLRALATSIGDRAALVLVASGAEETADVVHEALAVAKLRIPVLLDTDKAAATELGVRVTPTAFLIDAAGVLRYRGPIDDDRRARSRDARELLRPALETVLAGKTVESGDVRPFGSALR